jgi:hypothetical protein
MEEKDETEKYDELINLKKVREMMAAHAHDLHEEIEQLRKEAIRRNLTEHHQLVLEINEVLDEGRRRQLLQPTIFAAFIHDPDEWHTTTMREEFDDYCFFASREGAQKHMIEGGIWPEGEPAFPLNSMFPSPDGHRAAIFEVHLND